MSPAPSVTRETLEESWRLRLEETQTHYHKAQERYATLLDEQPPGAARDLRGTLDLAREAESKALAEYARVLRIFKELIVNGKIPDEQPATADRTTYEFRFTQHFNR